MGYCKVVGGYCTYTNDNDGSCARSNNECIYEDDEDYRKFEDEEDEYESD